MKDYNDMSEHPTETFSFIGECVWPDKMRIINQYVQNQKIIVVDITSYHNIVIRGDQVSCIDLDISGPIENIEELAENLGAVRNAAPCEYEYIIERKKP